MGIEIVINKHKKTINDPNDVWENTEMDKLRKSECLCLNCDRQYEDQPYSSCPVAAIIYKVCVKYHMAMAITRCGATDEHGDLLYKPPKK